MIGTVLAAIGAKVLEAIASQSLPMLSDFKVQVGKRFLDDALPTPRIVLVPTDGDCEAASVSASAKTYPSTVDDAAYRSWLLQKPLYNEWETIEAHVFTPASSPDDATELDLPHVLAQTVRWAAREVLSPGGVRQQGGRWDPDPQTQLTPQSHHKVVTFAVGLPLRDMPLTALKDFVPPGTTLDLDPKYQDSTEAP